MEIFVDGSLNESLSNRCQFIFQVDLLKFLQRSISACIFSDAFDHIETVGGLEVTVLQCTRLNTSLAAVDHNEVYCTLTLGEFLPSV